MKTNRLRVAVRAGLVAGVMVSAGCSGGGFGESVSVPHHRRQKLDDEFGAETKLVLPGEQGFNIAGAQRHSTGPASAESFARKTGTAGCSVSSEGEGTAWSEFQLGHVLQHDGTQPREVTVWFDVQYEYEVTSGGTERHDPKMAGLKVYVRDSNKQMLNKVMLLEQSERLGPHRWSGREAPSFDITMQPGLAYQFVVAGRVEVAGAEDAAPLTARIEVKNLQIEVEAN